MNINPQRQPGSRLPVGVTVPYRERPNSRFNPTGGGGDHIQSVDRTGNGSTINHLTSSGDGRLLRSDLRRAPPGSGPTPANATSQPPSIETLHLPDRAPVHQTQTSAGVGGDGPGISFTILPTEEDVLRMQTSWDKNGYIKRPMNAFMVWSSIHRHALRRTCPGAGMTDTSVQLGCEWSKLTEEEKRPYFEVAHKLKCIHQQQFPGVHDVNRYDYQFQPQKKKNQVPSGQGVRRHSSVSASQAMPSAQPKVLSPSMYTMVPYKAAYYPYLNLCRCTPMELYPRVQIHHASGSMEEEKNHHNTDPLSAKIPLASLESEIMQQKCHHPPNVGYEVPNNSTTTNKGRQQQLSVKVECKYEDDVDVVGLL